MSGRLAKALYAMGIRDERVLRAVAQVPRHLFVPDDLREDADSDRPLPIGHGQTISQPYIVAFMTEWLRLDGDERVLEVGTGSGYQAAVLALLAREVDSVEIIPELAARAERILLDTMGLTNIRVHVGDGAFGWPERAPFDRIIVTAAPPAIPAPLLEQLAPGGRMVIPVGEQEEAQVLKLVLRGNDGVTEINDILPVRFVPLRSGGGPAGR